MDKLYPKSYRLVSKQDFDQLKNKKTSYFRGRAINVVFCSNECSNARLGLAVSRKTGNAVVRNKIKRSIREWFRQSLLKNEPRDLLFISKKRSRCPENPKKYQDGTTEEFLELVRQDLGKFSRYISK